MSKKTAREVIAAAFGKLVSESNLGEPLRATGPDWILSALDAAGFVIVPKEPTQAMIEAGIANFYRAIIAAAKELP